MLAILSLSLGLSAHSATWKKIVSDSTIQVCPINYIFVPSLAPYTTRDFCVMKYEAKQDPTTLMATSSAAGTPWTGESRALARSNCKKFGQGYDLISNDQWQTIARNIAGFGENWTNGIVASGRLNNGNTNGGLGLEASIDDNNACYGYTPIVPSNLCSGSIWHAQRRTHKLSNGNTIWDFSGNKNEWVTNDSKNSNGANGFIATMTGGDVRQNRYGAHASTICTSPATNDYCGMGNGFFSTSPGGVFRGGDSSDNIDAGIFTTNLNFNTSGQAFITFRCIFAP